MNGPAGTMTGMNRSTGRALGGDAHLRQSIADILTTPIGSRVMRRDYGSLLLDLIDQPINPATRLRLFAAVAVALLKWEPRLRLTNIALAVRGPGDVELTLTGERTDTGSPGTIARLTLPLRSGSRPALA
jgi:uncharacterized protein